MEGRKAMLDHSNANFVSPGVLTLFSKSSVVLRFS